MNIFLQELSEAFQEYRIILIMGKAGWHRSKDLSKGENIRYIYQPPYSPELNPVEHLWAILMVWPVSAAKVIQEQPSTDGNMEASLISAAVRGEVLTVKVILKNTSGKKATPMFFFKDVYYTDLKDKKKYFALKDAEGQYIAGPRYDGSNGGRFWFDIGPDGKKIIWVKFPAPPQTTESVDIFLPGILPFEAVPLRK